MASSLLEFLNDKKVIYFLSVVIVIKLILINFIPVTPQEAYYWYYSKHPDFSYFDHPPMAAFSIWIGTHIFGDNYFGVKLLAVIWYLLTNILLYLTVNRFSRFTENSLPKEVGFYTIVFYNLTIFAHLYSTTIVPDSPLLFFWLAVIFSMQEFFITKRNYWWYIAGAFLGASLLSKYTAVILLGSVFIYLLIDKEFRSNLLSIHTYLAVVVAFIVFSPVFYWNYTHDWASFKFQFVERAENTKAITYKYIVQLILSQFFLLTPLIFIFVSKSVYRVIQKWKESSHFWFFLICGVSIIILFFYTSLTSLVKMNWLLPGYLPLIIIVAVLFYRRLSKESLFVKIGIGFSIVLILVGYSIQIIPNFPLGEGNTWSGWKETANKVFQFQNQLGGKDSVFVFSNSYKGASLLKFYLPDQQDTYAENIYGKHGLQFEYWNSLESLKGKNAIYVHDNRREYGNDLKYIKKYFDSIEPLDTLTSTFLNSTTRKIYCYLAKNYHGR